MTRRALILAALTAMAVSPFAADLAQAQGRHGREQPHQGRGSVERRGGERPRPAERRDWDRPRPSERGDWERPRAPERGEWVQRGSRQGPDRAGRPERGGGRSDRIDQRRGADKAPPRRERGRFTGEEDRRRAEERSARPDRGGGRDPAPAARQRRPRPGGYLPPTFRGEFVYDYQRYRLRPPPHGYAWVRVSGTFALVSLADGRVFDVVE